jgi:hypothetical protein
MTGCALYLFNHLGVTVRGPNVYAQFYSQSDNVPRPKTKYIRNKICDGRIEICPTNDLVHP